MTQAPYTCVGYINTHVNTNVCEISDDSHYISNNANSSTCATTDNNISAFNSGTINDSTTVATYNSDYDIHDTNRCKGLKYSTENMRAVVSIKHNSRYCNVNNYSTVTHNITSTNLCFLRRW